jgi:hypothetical protein
MGLFDVNIRQELESKKTEEGFLDYLEKKLKNDTYKELNKTPSTLTLDKYKAPNAFMKFNLSITFDTINNKEYLCVDGELQDVWFLVVFIVLAILLTQGIAIIPLIGFVYYQKRLVSKYLEEFINVYLQIRKNK